VVVAHGRVGHRPRRSAPGPFVWIILATAAFTGNVDRMGPRQPTDRPHRHRGRRRAGLPSAGVEQFFLSSAIIAAAAWVVGISGLSAQVRPQAHHGRPRRRRPAVAVVGSESPPREPAPPPATATLACSTASSTCRTAR
jgi:hypothetical protein